MEWQRQQYTCVETIFYEFIQSVWREFPNFQFWHAIWVDLWCFHKHLITILSVIPSSSWKLAHRLTDIDFWEWLVCVFIWLCRHQGASMPDFWSLWCCRYCINLDSWLYRVWASVTHRISECHSQFIGFSVWILSHLSESITNHRLWTIAFA